MSKLATKELDQYWKKTGENSLTDQDELNAVCYVGLPNSFNQFISNIHTEKWHHVIDQIETRPNSILDIGCGTGRWLSNLVRHYKQHELEYMGVDIDPKKISYCKSKFNSPNYKFSTVDLTQWKPKNNYDLINSVTVIQHLPYKEQDKVINNLANKLNTKGYLLMMELIDTHDTAKHVFPRSKKDWISLMDKHNLSLTYFSSVEHLPILRLLKQVQQTILGQDKFTGKRHTLKTTNKKNSLENKIIDVTMPFHKGIEPLAAKFLPNKGRVGVFLFRKN